MSGTKYIVSLSLFLLLAAYIVPAGAQDSYQTEISAVYSHFEDDADLEAQSYGIIAELYFSEVNTAGHPLAEAAFLERIGSVSVLVGRSELETDGSILEADGPQYGAEITLARPDMPIALSAFYTTTDLEFDSPLDGDYKINTYGIAAGYFLAKSFLVGLHYNHSEEDIDMRYFSFSSDTTLKIDNYGLSAKYVNEQGDGTAFNVEAAAEIERFDYESDDDESNTIVELSGDYYINHNLSVGAGIGLNSGENKDGEGVTYSMNARAFLTPNFSINAGFKTFIADNDEGEDADSYTVGVSVRL